MVAPYLHQQLLRVYPMLSIEEYILQLPEGVSKPAGTIGSENVPVFSIEDPTVVETILRMREASNLIVPAPFTCTFQG